MEKFSAGLLERHLQMVYLDQRGVARSSSPKDGNRVVEREGIIADTGNRCDLGAAELLFGIERPVALKNIARELDCPNQKRLNPSDKSTECEIAISQDKVQV
jgi:hypothetical protein